MIEGIRPRDESFANTPLTRERQNPAYAEILLDRIKTHSEWTWQHSVRVSETALDLAQAIGLSEADQETARIAGLLHDVGKTEIPNEILNNTNPELSPEQLALIESHPRISFMLLKPYNENVAKIVVAHHEVLQERKYPRIISRNDDNLEQMKIIVALSDKVDAGLSKRPYKPAWTREAVHDFLSRVCDPNLVSIAIRSNLSRRDSIFGV